MLKPRWIASQVSALCVRTIARLLLVLPLIVTYQRGEQRRGMGWAGPLFGDWVPGYTQYFKTLNKFLYVPLPLKEMGLSDHLTCLQKNPYAGQEATVRTGHGTIDWFQIGKGVRQGCILSPCLFNLHAEYIMWNARLDEVQAGIKISQEKYQ